MKGFFVILFLCCCAAFSQGQGYYWQSGTKENKIKYLSLEAGLGLRMYFGDIQSKGSVFNPVKFAYGAGVRYQMRPKLGFAIQGEGRGYKGKAEHGAYPDAIDEMKGKLWGGHFMVEYSWLKWEDFTRKQFTDRDPVTKSNLFLGAGFGVSQFSASFTSRTYVAIKTTDSLGRDTTLKVPFDQSGSASGIGMYVPVSFGGRYRFSPSWHITFELQRHFYITKNIDALVTKKYDGMGSFMVKVGYTFGQNIRKGDARKVSKKGKFK